MPGVLQMMDCGARACARARAIGRVRTRSDKSVEEAACAGVFCYAEEGKMSAMGFASGMEHVAVGG